MRTSIINSALKYLVCRTFTTPCNCKRCVSHRAFFANNWFLGRNEHFFQRLFFCLHANILITTTTNENCVEAAHLVSDAGDSDILQGFTDLCLQTVGLAVGFPQRDLQLLQQVHVSSSFAVFLAEWQESSCERSCAQHTPHGTSARN